jgi:hypothetical protein
VLVRAFVHRELFDDSYRFPSCTHLILDELLVEFVRSLDVRQELVPEEGNLDSLVPEYSLEVLGQYFAVAFQKYLLFRLCMHAKLSDSVNFYSSASCFATTIGLSIEGVFSTLEKRFLAVQQNQIEQILPVVSERSLHDQISVLEECICSAEDLFT